MVAVNQCTLAGTGVLDGLETILKNLRRFVVSIGQKIDLGGDSADALVHVGLKALEHTLDALEQRIRVSKRLAIVSRRCLSVLLDEFAMLVSPLLDVGVLLFGFFFDRRE